jgi:putative flavoprotein involved in K+ transport
MPEIDTVIIGAGQQGLSTSYLLQKKGVPHVVLERSFAGSRWANSWDSFRINTPNKFTRLPGRRYEGSDPDGFTDARSVVDFLGGYADDFGLPVKCGEEVTALARTRDGFLVQTRRSSFRCKAVVVAAGQYSRPKLPNSIGEREGRMNVLHSYDYRNPAQLPPGGVLVVGGGQTGAQITEELAESGRKVHWAVSGRPANVRRIEEWDFMELWEVSGQLHQSWRDHPLYKTSEPNALDKIRRMEFPLVSGRGNDGLGHAISYEGLSQMGVGIVGRMGGIRDGRIYLQDTLWRDLAESNRTSFEIATELAEVAANLGPRGRRHPKPRLEDFNWLPDRAPESLPIGADGVETILLTTGYRPDWGWVHIENVFDTRGYPIGVDGISHVPGLYFMGMFFQQTLSSTCLCNEGRDAEVVSRHLAEFLASEATFSTAASSESSGRDVVLVILPSLQDYNRLKEVNEADPTYDFRFLFDQEWSQFMEGSPEFNMASYTQRAIRYAAAHDAKGVVYSHDVASLVAAAICDATGLPGPSLSSITTSCHKFYSRSAESRPIGHEVIVLDSGEETSNKIGFPVQLKPSCLYFSALQTRVDNEAQLRPAVEELRRQSEPWFAPLKGFFEQFSDPTRFPLALRNTALIEEFVVAESQHAVEGWTDREGKHHLWAVSDNIYAADGSLDCNALPSALAQHVQARIVERAFATVGEHGIRNGFWNVEIWVLKCGDIRVTEVNSRAVASMSPLYAAIYGDDQYPNILRLALGKPVTAPNERPSSGHALFGGMFSLATRRAGRVGDLLHTDRIREVKEWPGVVGVSLMLAPDTTVGWKQTGGVSTLGRAYVVGSDLPSVQEMAAKMRAHLMEA